MNWNTLISAKRFGLEEFHQERHENRSEFQRDYDRLVFSAPFRRLQNKTQVFPLPGSVFVHNRLTHSLEVSCVGRSLGNDVSKALIARRPELQDSYKSINQHAQNKHFSIDRRLNVESQPAAVLGHHKYIDFFDQLGGDEKACQNREDHDPGSAYQIQTYDFPVFIAKDLHHGNG